MAHKHSFFSLSPTLVLRRAAIILLSMGLSFAIGIKTAGDFHPIGSTQAGALVIAGDLNGNGRVDADDARRALEISEGLRIASESELAADPSRDLHITPQDALLILQKIPAR